MHVFEVVIALLVGGALLSALARRISTPYPSLVALAGVALALLPNTPTVHLDPALALALFVAPVLLDAAFDSSPRDLRNHWRWVLSLALGAVLLTVAGVAVVVRWIVPDMPWAAAVALGAIVAPPDAAAATAVLKQLRPPHRLLVILEGESLFNDASALLIYRLAVGAMLAGSLAVGTVIPTLLVVTAGSVVLGLVLARVLLALMARVHDVATAVVLQFGSTFGVWILAERLHLSGILTMVVYAMAVARPAGELIPARIRVPSYAVWEVAVFVLNVLAFIIVGLQLRGIGARLDGSEWIEYAGVALAVTVTVIVVRMIWVSGASAFSRWWCSVEHRAQSGIEPIAITPRASLLVGWCGMRGIVTLAAALALPTTLRTGEPWPYRDLILFTAFGVVVGTLVVQGLTLRLLMNRLALHDDGSVEREAQMARIETLEAGLAAIEASNSEAAEYLRRRIELLLRRAEPNGRGEYAREDSEIFGAVMAAARQRLMDLRASGRIGDAAFQQVEQVLDMAQLDHEQTLLA